MFYQFLTLPAVILVCFIATSFDVITNATPTQPATETTTETGPPLFEEETDATVTTVAPTTRTARSTVPRPNFTMPPDDKGKIFRDHFALYNCELMKQCNVIPRNKSCGRDWYYGTIAWFENVCVLWKTNCFKLGLFFVQNSAMCEDFNLMHPDKTLWTFTNAMIDPPKFAPMGFNPYYTPPKYKDGLL